MSRTPRSTSQPHIFASSTATTTPLPKDAPLPRGAPTAALCPGRTRHGTGGVRQDCPPRTRAEVPRQSQGPGGAALTGCGAERRSGAGAAVAADPRCHALPAAPFYTCRRRRLRGRPRAPASQSPRRPRGGARSAIGRRLGPAVTSWPARGESHSQKKKRGGAGALRRAGRGPGRGAAPAAPPLHRSRVATSAAVGPHCRAGPLPTREFPPPPPPAAAAAAAPERCPGVSAGGWRGFRTGARERCAAALIATEGSSPRLPQLLGRGGSAGGGTRRRSPGQGTSGTCQQPRGTCERLPCSALPGRGGGETPRSERKPRASPPSPPHSSRAGAAPGKGGSPPRCRRGAAGSCAPPMHHPPRSSVTAAPARSGCLPGRLFAQPQPAPARRGRPRGHRHGGDTTVLRRDALQHPARRALPSPPLPRERERLSCPPQVAGRSPSTAAPAARPAMPGGRWPGGDAQGSRPCSGPPSRSALAALHDASCRRQRWEPPVALPPFPVEQSPAHRGAVPARLDGASRSSHGSGASLRASPSVFYSVGVTPGGRGRVFPG